MSSSQIAFAFRRKLADYATWAKSRVLALWRMPYAGTTAFDNGTGHFLAYNWETSCSGKKKALRCGVNTTIGSVAGSHPWQKKKTN